MSAPTNEEKLEKAARKRALEMLSMIPDATFQGRRVRDYSVDELEAKLLLAMGLGPNAPPPKVPKFYRPKRHRSQVAEIGASLIGTGRILIDLENGANK